MSPGSPSRILLAVLLGVALLTRAAGDHLHLCLDGNEAPVAIHGADGGAHHAEASDDTGHSDQDIDLASAMPQKVSWSTFDDFALPGSVLLLLFFPRAGAQHTPLAYAAPFDSHPAFLVPPLRGPPSRTP